jgi:hypothetical protein
MVANLIVTLVTLQLDSHDFRKMNAFFFKKCDISYAIKSLGKFIFVAYF